MNIIFFPLSYFSPEPTGGRWDGGGTEKQAVCGVEGSSGGSSTHKAESFSA